MLTRTRNLKVYTKTNHTTDEHGNASHISFRLVSNCPTGHKWSDKALIADKIVWQQAFQAKVEVVRDCVKKLSADNRCTIPASQTDQIVYVVQARDKRMRNSADNDDIKNTYSDDRPSNVKGQINRNLDFLFFESNMLSKYETNIF